MGKVLLEGAQPRESSVSQCGAEPTPAVRVQPRRDHEDLAGESPRALERREALIGVLDDVDDVAKIDHIRLLPIPRPMRRIPAIGFESTPNEIAQIRAPSASVIEEALASRQHTVVERQPNRTRQICPVQRGAVSLDAAQRGGTRSESDGATLPIRSPIERIP